MTVADRAPRAGSLTLPAAVLWDMDGTLIDTEPYWVEQEHLLVESHGGTWSHEHAMALVGNDLRVSAEYIIEHSTIEMSVDDVVEVLLEGVKARVREHVPWRPGALELLEALVAQGVPCALVTMSWRSLVDILVGSLPPKTFSAIITGDEVHHGKPDAEPYLRAARALDVALADCVAIEDSPPGVASAVAAGVPTIAVPHAVPVPQTPGAVQLPSLDRIRPIDLLAIIAAGSPHVA